MIGQTISHHRILEKLGEGGMGVVYKAEDTKLRRPVALKVLPRQALITEEDKTRFVREAQAAASLSHPNIAIIHEFDEVDDPVTGGKLAFIAMEYVDGQTLNEKVRERPLPIKDAVDDAIAVAEGLAKAHEKGIIHRDIKSDNVMVSNDGVVKIMDFGLAEIAGRTRVTKEGMTVGTAAYMSPEQALGEKLDQRTDIWSLGVVLYEMITGRLPFAGEYEQAIVYRILNEEPEPITSLRSNVPMELERIVKKAMEKDRSTRYQTAGDLLADLRKLLKGLESGITTEAPTKRARPQKRRMYLYGGLVAFAAVVVIAALYIVPRPAEVIDSIAVLPLDNLSRDPEQEYFVDGMHEALIAELSKISALKVISRTSAMQYRGVKKPMPQIARELGVDALIEGSVAREGDQVRITVQLIHGPSDKHLWAESYQRELRGILALQSELARAIASQIKVTLTPSEQVRLASTRPVNPEAYEFYLRGRFYSDKRTPESLKKALEYFQAAIDSDPAYALGYVGLADTYRLTGSYAVLPPNEAYPRARTALVKALELDDTLAEAHASLATSHWDDFDWQAAEREFRRALELNPNYPTAHHQYAVYLAASGRQEQAIKEIKRARELDPLSPVIRGAQLGILFHARKYDETIEEGQKALEAEAPFLYFHKGAAYVEKGMFDKGVAEFEERAAVSPTPTILARLGYAYARVGRRAEALKILRELEELSKREYVSSYDIALVYAGLGDKTESLAWLERAYENEEGIMWLHFLRVSPCFDALRDDTRFQDLLRRMNFPE